MKSATDGSGTQKISTKNYGPNMQKKDSKIGRVVPTLKMTLIINFQGKLLEISRIFAVTVF